MLVGIDIEVGSLYMFVGRFVLLWKYVVLVLAGCVLAMFWRDRGWGWGGITCASCAPGLSTNGLDRAH